jgi:para-nitrobenzyl esterase
LRGRTRQDATDLAERLLAIRGIRAGELEKLQEMPAKRILDGISRLPPLKQSLGLLGEGTGQILLLSPVVDGLYLPSHPFDPAAAPTMADVPLIIGTNRDESALFLAPDPRRRRLTETELHQRLSPLHGERTDHIIEVYKRIRPAATPWDLLLRPSSALVIIESQPSASKSIKPSVVANASAAKGRRSSSRST